jgi:acetylornithine/succinyldiaminopimelate/putrescine aminotransferase
MRNLKELFHQHVGQTSDAPFGLTVDRAKGIYIYDDEGKAYIDLISGIGPAAVGHGHPKVLAAGHAQMDRFMHTMVYGEHIQAPQVQLADYLASLLPEPLSSTYFLSSGTEAAEAALKLAKKATGRFEIVACRNAYHGSTHGTSALKSDDSYARAFRPYVPGTRFIDYDAPEDLGRITTSTAAVIAETYQGEAGCRVADNQWLHALRSRCTEVGALLILDEIQVGCGRTGQPFAFMHSGIQPDIVLLAKALGGGMPIGAFVTSRELMAEMSNHPILGHCTTFGGHPVSCATGYAALQLIMENKWYETVEEKAQQFRSALIDHPLVQGISGKGLWMAVDVGTFETVQALMWKAKSHGLITDWFLYNNHSFRICPPLNITEEEIQRSCDILIRVLDELEDTQGQGAQ